MPKAWRNSIVVVCLALILFAALIPTASLHPVVLISFGFVFTGLPGVPIERSSEDCKPQSFQFLRIHSSRPPPAG